MGCYCHITEKRNCHGKKCFGDIYPHAYPCTYTFTQSIAIIQTTTKNIKYGDILGYNSQAQFGFWSVNEKCHEEICLNDEVNASQGGSQSMLRDDACNVESESYWTHVIGKHWTTLLVLHW